MAYAKIPGKDAVLLVRALGLLVNQAGIYGPAHNVTRSAARSVYAELEQAVKTYGPIEIALQDNRVLINGSVDGLDAAAGKNLRDRLLLHNIGGIVFLAPSDVNEFMTCITLIGTPPAVLAADGGFEAALNRAGLKSVRAITVAYQQVGNDAPETLPEQPPPEEPKAPPQRRVPDGYSTGVLDLSAALDGSFVTVPDEPEKPATAAATAASERKKRTATLASLLRDTAALLEHDDALTDEEQQQKVITAINRIRDALIASTAESERQIALLADQVDEDRQTIASIESAARRRGIGLKLSRGELVERYAELNQEIMQPLTVSTGVIDMLHSGKGGPLTMSQRDLLQLAADSVERVNQLVAYMRRIAGLPESYTPDSEIIADSYR